MTDRCSDQCVPASSPALINGGLQSPWSVCSARPVCPRMTAAGPFQPVWLQILGVAWLVCRPPGSQNVSIAPFLPLLLPPPTFLWCLSRNGFIEGSVGPSVGMARERFVWEGTRGDQRPPDEQKGGKEHVPAITGSPRILNSAFCWEGRPPFSVLGPCFSCGAVRAPLLL